MSYLSVKDFILNEEGMKYSGVFGNVGASIANTFASKFYTLTHLPEWFLSKKIFSLRETPEFYANEGNRYISLAQNSSSKNQCLDVIERVTEMMHGILIYKDILSKYQEGAFRLDRGEISKDVSRAAITGVAGFGAGYALAHAHKGPSPSPSEAIGLGAAVGAMSFTHSIISSIKHGVFDLFMRKYDDDYFRANVDLMEKVLIPLLKKAKDIATAKYHELHENYYSRGPINFFE